MQPSGGIHDQQVHALGLGRLDGVKHHRCRIRAFRVLDDRNPCPFSPHGQLLCRRRAEGISRAQHDLPADGLEAQCQLADGCGFAHAVHADQQHHHRPLQRRPRDIHLFHHDLLEHLPGFSGVLDLAGLHTVLQFIHDRLGGFQAAVGHEQDVLQLFVEVIVDLPVLPDHVVDFFGHVSPGFAQSFPQSREKALFLLFAHMNLETNRSKSISPNS